MAKETSIDTLNAMMKYERGVSAHKKDYKEHSKAKSEALKAKGEHHVGGKFAKELDKHKGDRMKFM